MKLEVSSVSGPHWKNAKKFNMLFAILAFSVRVFHLYVVFKAH